MHLHSEEEIIAYAKNSGLSQEHIHRFIETGEQLVEDIALDIPMNTILFPIYEPSAQIKESFAAREDQLIIS